MNNETFQLLLDHFTPTFGFVVNLLDFTRWDNLPYIKSSWNISQISHILEQIHKIDEDDLLNPIANRETRAYYLGES